MIAKCFEQYVEKQRSREMQLDKSRLGKKPTHS